MPGTINFMTFPRPISLFLMLFYLSFLSGLCIANDFSPFDCRLNEGPKRPTEQGVLQWLTLFGVEGAGNLQTSSSANGNLSFEEQYWNTLKKAKKYVRACDQTIAFYERLGEKVESFFDQHPAIDVNAPSTIFFHELVKREKIMAIRGLPKLELHGDIDPTLQGPYWIVELSLQEDKLVFARSRFGLSTGPIGALASYEFLRQLRQEFPKFLSLGDHLIDREKLNRLNAEFPALSPIFNRLASLPERSKIEKWVARVALFVILFLISLIIIVTYKSNLIKRP